MKISIKAKAPVLVLSLHGELVLNNLERAQQELESFLQENNNIVIDGAELTYVDSAGLGLFLVISNKLKQLGLESLVFANLTPVVKRSLEVTHLVQLMPIYNSQREAVAGFTQCWSWRVPSRIVYVKSVSNKVLESLSFLNLDKDFLTEIRLCVEEAVINAIKHGNRLESQKLATVSYKLDNRRLEISVSDEGEGFDATTRGKGLILIFNFMDEVKFNEKGSMITVVKNI